MTAKEARRLIKEAKRDHILLVYVFMGSTRSIVIRSKAEALGILKGIAPSVEVPVIEDRGNVYLLGDKPR